jgi:cytoskeleton protein RodZ
VKKADVVAQPTSEQPVGGYNPEPLVLPEVNDQLPSIPAEAPKPAPANTPTPPPSTLTLAPTASKPATPATSNLHPTPGTARLKLTFSQQSWVRVFEHDGKEVFHKTGLAGTEDTAEGIPPLKVEVGNAAGVQVTYNDKPVDMAPHTKANVARFSLE